MGGDPDETAAGLVDQVLERLGLDVDHPHADRWDVVLPGERKRALPVRLELDARTLRVTAHLARPLDEGHAQAYAHLLRRNARHGPVHFALDGDDGIVLVGSMPRAALDEESLDRLLGALATEADEAFERLLRTGFRGYIDHEQAWRDRIGLPPNPIDRGRPSGP
ncbi:MAG: YbjN domain-containing protein [Nitriliruptoraceae bacterium]